YTGPNFPTRVHVAPASVLLRTPALPKEKEPKLMSPVAAYTTVWLFGSTVTSSTAVVGTEGVSVVTVQVVAGLQQLVVFQIPPPSCAMYATVGSTGSKAIALTRPETRPKVKHGAWQPVLSCGCGPSGRAAASELARPAPR